jgi:hypothetical protein
MEDDSSSQCSNTEYDRELVTQDELEVDTFLTIRIKNTDTLKLMIVGVIFVKKALTNIKI